MRDIMGWFQEAIEDFVKDLVKKSLNWILLHIWTIWVGILLAAVSARWLHIWIPVPLSMMVVTFLLVGGLLLAVIRYRKSLRRARNTIYYEDFVWKIDSRGHVAGPYCPICEGSLDWREDLGRQFEKIADMILMGRGPRYEYYCVKCDFRLEKSLSPEELRALVSREG